MDCDKLSEPIPDGEIEDTEMAIAFPMPIDQDSKGSTRYEIRVIWSKDHPLIQGMSSRISYAVTLGSSSATFGHCFHETTRQILYAVQGGAIVVLENPETGEQEKWVLTPRKNIALYIKPGTAYAIFAGKFPAVIIIVPDQTDAEDEFPYPIKYPKSKS